MSLSSDEDMLASFYSEGHSQPQNDWSFSGAESMCWDAQRLILEHIIFGTFLFNVDVFELFAVKHIYILYIYICAYTDTYDRYWIV